MLEKALAGNRTYWTWIAFLLVVIGAGGICWFWQLTTGLTITGMSRDVVWGFYIAQFTFLVGVAASAVMVVLPYYLHNYKAFGKMTILGEFLAITASDGETQLDHAVVSYDPLGETAEIWFQAGTLSELDDEFFLDTKTASGAIGFDLTAPNLHLDILRPAHDMTLAIRIDILVLDN